MKKLITLLLCGILLVGCTTNKSFNLSTEDNLPTQDLENKKTTILISMTKSNLELFKQECLDVHIIFIIL
ncbi:MAG: hypothetical protein N4A63_00365 [Vallitalea sp.]|jgi:uncharacterized protein YcfL|nr:hypothetical protein [Vallitalea sp.]